MSIALQKQVWKLALLPSEKLVLLKLADHVSDKTGEAYPSIRSLARDTGLGERQVQRYINGFVKDGTITVKENAKGGRGKSRTYRFTMLKGDTQDAEEIDERVTPVTPKGDTGDASLKKERVTPMTKRVSPMTAKGDTHDPTYIRTESPVNHQEPSVASKMPRNGPAQVLVAVLYEDVLQIGPPTKYGRVVGEAQQLVNAGCTPDELRTIVAWLETDSFWTRRGITMTDVMNQRDAWRSSQQSKPSTDTPWQTIGGDQAGYDPHRTLTPEAQAEYQRQLAQSMTEAAEFERRRLAS